MISRFIPHLASLVLFTSIVACGSSSNQTSSTTSVSDKTIEGVCKKLNSLSCAQPNCVQTLTYAQQRCTAPTDNFQGLIDCMSIATFQCGGSPNIPRTAQCEADINRINLCATSGTYVPPSSGNGPSGNNTLPDAGLPDVGNPSNSGQTCTTADDCTTWTCTCADGAFVDLSACTNNKCEDALTLCTPTNAAHVDACKAHGGV